MNGLILYRGPSMIDGAPIVVVATGLETKSTNAKTGAKGKVNLFSSSRTA